MQKSFGAVGIEPVTYRLPVIPTIHYTKSALFQNYVENEFLVVSEGSEANFLYKKLRNSVWSLKFYQMFKKNENWIEHNFSDGFLSHSEPEIIFFTQDNKLF